ncbi:hypothetical protein [Pararhizobium sp. O133]|uniref:hypothetical protein n=1 Tax=Pararhizobium sp. O133 TaxID=3449278 RepID=UPI003F6850B5
MLVAGVCRRCDWTDDRGLVHAAPTAGVVAIPVSPTYVSASPEPRLLLGFSGLTRADVGIATQRLASLLEREDRNA